MQRAALDACRRATEALLAAEDHRDDAWRSLEKSLGFTWSVVVAANPALALPAFEELERSGSVVAERIARSNRSKARMRRIGSDPTKENRI
jgi:hypothetical protein